jgi:hypothetical protein
MGHPVFGVVWKKYRGLSTASAKNAAFGRDDVLLGFGRDIK